MLFYLIGDGNGPRPKFQEHALHFSCSVNQGGIFFQVDEYAGYGGGSHAFDEWPDMIVVSSARHQGSVHE